MAANEYRMRARWRLGQMLAAFGKQKVGGGRGGKLTITRLGKSLMELLDGLSLDKNRAIEAKRIGHLPKIELENL